MSSFDAGRIVASADLDRNPFQRGLAEAKREAREFADGKYSAKLGADTKDADAKVYDFKTRLERLGSSTVSPKVALENGAGLRALIDFNDRLDKLRAKVATAKADVDDERAKAKLDALDIRLRTVGAINARPRVTVEGVERANLQLDSLGLKLAGINAAGGGGGGRGRLTGGGGGFLSRFPKGPGLLGLGVGAALPLAGPLAGVGLGVGASFLSPTLAGGLGLGAFGIGAKASIQTVSKDEAALTKLTQRYNAAVTNKQRAAVLRQEHMLWESLDPAQRRAVKNVDEFEAAFKRYQKALQPQSFAVLADGSKLAEKGLRDLLPAAKGVGNELDQLLLDAQNSLGSPFWRHFFHDFLAVEAPLAVHTLGISLGNTVQGIARLSERFAPLGHDLEGFLESTSGGFDKWTKGGGPARFVAFVEKEGPIVERDLKGLGRAIEGLGKGLAPIGQVELKALGPVLDFIGKIGDEHPAVITAVATGLLGIGAGLKVIAGVRGIQGILGGIGGLGRGGGGGGLGGVIGKGSPVPVYVTNWGGEGGLPGGGGGVVGESKVAGGLRNVASVAGPVGIASAAFVAGANAYALTNKEALNRVQHPTGVNLGYVPYVQKYVAAQYPNSVGTPYFNQISAQALQHFSPRSGISSFTPTGVPASVLASVKQYQGNVNDAAKAAQDASAKVRGVDDAVGHIPGTMRRGATATDVFTKSLHNAGAGARTAGDNIGTDLGAGLALGLERQLHAATVTAKIQVSQLIKHIRFDQNGVNAGSPSKNMMPAGKDMADGLLVGWIRRLREADPAFKAGALSTIHGLEASAATYVARSQGRLSNARAKLSSDVTGRRDYITGLTSSYEGYAGIAGAVNSNGSVGNVSGFLRSRLSKLRQFVDDLGKLRKRGLSPMLLQQIADLGPDGGLGLAQSILSGASGSVGTLNRLERQVDSYAGRGAAIAGHGVFDTRIAGDEKHVREQIAELKKMREDLRALVVAAHASPQAFAAAIEAAFRNSDHHHRANASAA